MTNFIDKYNMIVASMVTLLAAVFGALWFVFLAFMALNILDWLTGWYKSRRLRKESSLIGVKGIIKKLGYWVIVAVAFIVSIVFVEMGKVVLHVQLDFLMGVGWFTLACLMVNEARSILENLMECGYNVPVVLTKGLAVADKLINESEENEDGTQN